MALFDTVHEKQVKNQEKFIEGAKEYARVKLTDKPEKRLNAMHTLKEDLLDLTEDYQIKLKALLERFAEQTFNEETQDGLLEVPIQDYSDCFHVDIERVEELLDSEVERMED